LLPAPFDLNREHLELLYRALGRGLVACQYVEGTLYLAAFAACGLGHVECAKQFYGRFAGAGGRLNFTDRALKAKLDSTPYERSWRPIYDELQTFVRYRNSLAHFEVYHITDESRLASEPPTKYNVILSESHMNAEKRTSERVASLSIEQIELNNESVREEAYKIIYFVVDHFPLDAFLDKGLLPITEVQLKGFYWGPRLPEFPPPNYTAN
jgi:hypothetical protein